MLKELIAGSLVGLSALCANASPINSFKDQVPVTPKSKIIYLEDRGIKIDGKTPECNISIGFYNKHNILSGYLENAIDSGHPSAGSGLIYLRENTEDTKGIPQDYTWNTIRARADLNKNNIYEANEEFLCETDSGIKVPMTSKTQKIIPKNIITPEPTTALLTLASGIYLLKRPKKD